MKRPLGHGIPKFFSAIKDVRSNDRALLLLTNGYFEVLIDQLILAKCKHAKRILEDGKTYSYSTKLVVLNENGIINDSLFDSLDKFRRLRNRAAHEVFFTVTKTDYDHILIWKGWGSFKPELFEYCAALAGLLWNSHLEVFGSLMEDAKLNRTPKSTTTSVMHVTSPRSPPTSAQGLDRPVPPS